MWMLVLRLLFGSALSATVYLAMTRSPWATVIEADATRHFAAFFVLPVLASAAWPRMSPWHQFAVFAALGAGIEVAQGTVAIGREASFDDWIVDLIALSVALLAVELLALRHRLIQRRA